MRIFIRCLHLDHSEHVDRHAREKIDSALGKFARRIDRVDVLIEDLHGTKHGVERRCVFQVKLIGAADALVQHVDADVYHAIDEAARRTKRTVRRRINRRRDRAHHRAVSVRTAA